MAHQFSVAVRNARLDAIETAAGPSPILQGRTGTPPANCAAASTGTILFSVTLPADWMAAASAGSKVKTGTWATTAVAAGTLGHFRLFDSTGTTCHWQGTITVTGGGGELTVENLSVALNQPVSISGCTWNEGGA